ncbi:MAG TPA: hypothetical protein VN677_16205 [Gemmatimonadaceae bacterium]|jgi:hypothetical protein|nr:hypothetical protein [Gemmatimonadaceae bacterium]
MTASDSEHTAVTRRQKRPGSVKARAMVAAAVATIITLVLVFIGSRGFADFDAALIGYFVATVFAIAALTYRYALWIERPPTGHYFRAGWATFLSWKNFRRYTTLVPRALWTDIFGQTFIRKRSTARWLTHLAIFWGVVLSVLVTVPLTFGWVRFTLVPPDRYTAWFFGFPVLTFPIHAGIGFATFHVLDFTAVLLIAGVTAAMWRRIRDTGLLTTQRFGFDLMPLILLFAIAITGLALTASSTWWGGAFYWFIALVHQVVVVLWLISLPFGKFFHIVERPASIGVTLYQQVAQDVEYYGHEPQPAPPLPPRPVTHCRRCGVEAPSALFITDLEGVLADLGQRYDLGAERGLLQDYCPTCKRLLRANAYYALLKRDFL